MKSFIPPAFSLPLAWIVDAALPALLKQMYNIEEVRISAPDRGMLRGLREERMLYFSNHPSTAEPGIAYHVANVMGSRFNYMASRPVFDWGYGAVGQVIRNVGAFSVLAGAADKESLKTARKLLASPQGKLVIYPEGAMSGENDNLLPFMPGATQIGFWGFEEARKNDPSCDVHVVPSFVKYVLKADRSVIENELREKLRVFEWRLGIEPGRKNLLRRFLTLGRVLLERTEVDYRIPPASTTDWEYRVGRVRHAILDGVAERLQLRSYPSKGDAIAKLRHLFTITELLDVGSEDPTLPRADKETLDWAKKECKKAYDFIVINPQYLISWPTAERFVEWLGRFESLIYGKTEARPRVAHVLFARPFKLSDYYEEYKKSKRQTVEAVTTRLRRDMEDLLEKARPLCAPIVAAGDVGMEG